MNNPEQSPLRFAQIGDLHLTHAGEQNFKDYCAILAQIEIQCKGLDFVFLPGDNGDHGRGGEYRLVATPLRMLSVPYHIITGDHDMEQGSLINFYQELAVELLPYVKRIRRYACLFLDCCGPGSGGPDFRIGNTQLLWLKEALDNAEKDGLIKVVFMHTYPDDLVDYEEKETVIQWFKHYEVRLVAMGHTHFNELANDGTTVFSATRSTGQIDEGVVGYSITTLDENSLCWRFKPLDEPFPFVMITHPTDARLEKDNPSPAPAGAHLVRAVIFGLYQPEEVAFQVDGQNWVRMQYNRNTDSWEGHTDWVLQAAATIRVRVLDVRNRPGYYQISYDPKRFKKPIRSGRGSDEDRILYWPENGIPGSQLGPNRNAKPYHNPHHP